MYQKMLNYYLESNYYFLELVDDLLDWLNEEIDEDFGKEIIQIVWNKLGSQGGRYSLKLNNTEIKQYLSYCYYRKSAYVIFLLWLGLSKKEIQELTSHKDRDAFSITLDILRNNSKKIIERNKEYAQKK